MFVVFLSLFIYSNAYAQATGGSLIHSIESGGTARGHLNQSKTPLINSRSLSTLPRTLFNNITIIDNGITLNCQNEMLCFSIGIGDAEQIDRLVIRVDDSGGMSVTDRSINNPKNSETVTFNLANFIPEETYSFQVYALNRNNEYIVPEGENSEVLLTKSFTMPAVRVSTFESKIETVNVEYESMRFIIDLALPSGNKIQLYSGQIVENDSGRSVHKFESNVFNGDTIITQLPQELRTPEAKYDYTLELILEISDENDNWSKSEVSREFSPNLPVAPSFIQTLISRLGSSPVFLFAIMTVALSIPILIIRRRRQAKAAEVKVKRPPVDNYTILAEDLVFPPVTRESNAGEVGNLGRAPEGRLQQTLLHSQNRVTQQIQPIQVRVFRMPKNEIVHEWRVSSLPATLGRANCDLVIRGDNHISRLHIEIGREDNAIYVKDLNSKVGVRINKRRLPVGVNVTIRPKTQIQLSSKTTIELM
ncbi:MAG: FHA domain-containing protein [Candidatus Promineifilaceae bacterium]